MVKTGLDEAFLDWLSATHQFRCDSLASACDSLASACEPLVQAGFSSSS
jgi:hypothetical protein